MIRSTRSEHDAAMAYGLSVNAFGVMFTPVRDVCAWTKAIASCSQTEQRLLLRFFQQRDQDGASGYKTKIVKLQSALVTASARE